MKPEKVTAGDGTPCSSLWRARNGKDTELPSPAVTRPATAPVAEVPLSEPRHVDRALADVRRQHYESLTADEKIAAVRRLARSGLSVHGIAAASGLSVEMVRQVVGEPRAAMRR